MPNWSRAAQLAALMSVATAALGAEPLMLTRDDDSAARRVPAGAEIALALPVQAGTGFAWQPVPERHQPGPLALQRNVTLHPGDGAHVLGSWVNQTIVYKAEKPGSATLAFQLLRPWETGPGAETFTVTLTVE